MYFTVLHPCKTFGTYVRHPCLTCPSREKNKEIRKIVKLLIYSNLLYIGMIKVLTTENKLV